MPTSTTPIVGEITLPHDVVIGAATELIAWDRRVRNLIDYEGNFGGEGPADIGPGEVGMQLLLAAVRSAHPELDECAVHEHHIVKAAWARAYENDATDATIAPKSRAGLRKVPIVAALRTHLAAHKLRRGAEGGYTFGSGERPFNRDAVVARAEKAWKEAKLDPIGLHEARHTCASIFIGAGVNLKALSSYLGHASITITLDRYGHLMPGNEDEAVGLVDRYLDRAAASGLTSS